MTIPGTRRAERVAENAGAVTLTLTGDTQATIIFNKKYEFEPIGVISDTLAHEPLHDDGLVDNKEEMLMESLDSTLYATFIHNGSVNPALNTELTRRYNTRLMALINSRDSAGNIRILTSAGNVYPGGAAALANFAAAFPGALTPGTSLPGSRYLDLFLLKLTGPPSPGQGPALHAAFDDATVRRVDANIHRGLSPDGWVAVARALRLQMLSGAAR